MNQFSFLGRITCCHVYGHMGTLMPKTSKKKKGLGHCFYWCPLGCVYVIYLN